jgi:hypothetical protein
MGKRNKGFIMAGLTLGGLLLIGSPAGAQPYHHPYNVDQREDYQQQRIQQGIDSGALNPGEARYLEREQARIQAMEERMRADGHLSPWERRRLHEMQDRANRDIYRLEHNRQTAEDWNGNHYGWGEHRHSRRHKHGRHYGWQDYNQGGWGDQAYDPNYSGSQAGWQGSYNGWGGGGYGWQGNNSQTGTTTTTNTQGRRGNRYGGGGSTTGTSTNGATLGGNLFNGTTTGGTSTGVTTATGSTTGTIPNWLGNQTSGNVTSTNGTTTSGTAAATNAQVWQGRRSGGNGYIPGSTATNGTTTGMTAPSGATAATTQGWRNNYARSGPAGAFRQPVPQARSFSQPANWQGQPRFQQARPRMPQTMMRPNAPMMARQPGGFAGTVNRANFSPTRMAPRRR